MKKLKIVAFVLLITIVILNVFSGEAFALNPADWEPSVNNDNSLNERIGGLLGAIQVLGVLVSVIVLMIIGIKYMVGSAEEKAINKKAMIPYLVGAVMVFSVTTIPNFIYQFSQSLFEDHEYLYYPLSYGESNYTLKHIKYCICNKCDGAEIQEYHTWDENGKCTLCGLECEHYYNGGHIEYKDLGNGYHTKQQCVICGAFNRELHGEWQNGNISMSMICGKCGASCNHENGYRAYVWEDDTHHVYAEICSTCGMTRKDERDKKEHQFDASGKCSICQN